MTDWFLTHGSQSVKPAELDTTSSDKYVYQRRNVQRVTVENFGFTSEFWQYEERKLAHGEYEKLLESELTQTQLAITELYESLLEG